MSIVIKGIDLPKDAQAVQISYWTKDGHYITESYPPSRIVEIPTPHGRLIDADELQELYADADGIDISNYDVKVAVIRQNIKDMPTILEAEEK